jgi:hypothetical protein
MSLPATASGRELTPAQVSRHVLFGRALEAVIWGMPVVNYDLMYQEMVRKTRGGFNQILYWSRLLDWKNQTLTPNPDVIYLMPFFNTQDGPVVLEVPPADQGVLNGSIMNRWQAAIADVGPGGADQGKGGKYLVLPPGYQARKVPAGYIPMPSDSYLGYALVRSLPRSSSSADVAKAIAYAKRIKVYPLSKADDPPVTVYIDASDVVFDATIPYDLRFFESLHRMIQAEPWLERDKAMIDPLKSLGIERGKPFRPDTSTRHMLNEAGQEARIYLESNFRALPSFYEGEHWFFPASPETVQATKGFWNIPDSYPTQNRGLVYAIAYFSAMHAGDAQYYLMSNADKVGQPFKGDTLYGVTVPAHAPVSQYWSMTVYNRDTHTFIRNAPWVGRSSQTQGLYWNKDGSADIYFGPIAPFGKEFNWVPTDPRGRFEVLARFYGPQQALFDKSWKLPDVQRVH